MKLSINDINNLQAENEKLKEFIMGRPNRDKVEVFCKLCICRACDEVKRLKDELSTYGATGICETCSDKANLEADKLKQENERLKAQKDKYYQQTLDDEIQVNELYQEIERLKSENETLNYQWNKQSEIGDEWYKLAEKYKVALQDIKEMCKKHLKAEKIVMVQEVINLIEKAEVNNDR